MAVALLAELRRAGAEEPSVMAEAELNAVLQSMPESVAGEVWAETGALAGVARFQLQAERRREAAATYQTLQQPDHHFPEASLGIARSVSTLQAAAEAFMAQGNFAEAAQRYQDLLSVETALLHPDRLSALRLQLGDAHWKAGNDAEAMEQFQQALACASTDAAATQRAVVHGRIGLAQLTLGDIAGARASDVEALRLFQDAGRPDAGYALAGASIPLIRNVTHFWTIDSRWEVLASDATAPKSSPNVVQMVYTPQLPGGSSPACR